MHITASVFINDDEHGLHQDYDDWLEKLAPHEPVSGYRHNVGEDNADAHMKRQIMGREVVVAITDGQLDFGTWEQIFYGEFDGRRRKTRAGEDHRGVKRGRVSGDYGHCTLSRNKLDLFPHSDQAMLLLSEVKEPKATGAKSNMA